RLCSLPCFIRPCRWKCYSSRDASGGQGGADLPVRLCVYRQIGEAARQRRPTACGFALACRNFPGKLARDSMKLFWLPVLLLSAATLWAAEPRPVYKLSAAELEARLRNDAQAVEVERHGLREVISYVEAHPDLFPAQPPPGLRLLRREQKEAVWS